MQDTVTTAEDVADWVAAFARDLFARLDSLAELLAGQLAVETPRRADLAIEQASRALIEDARLPVAGAGAVLAPGVLADAAYWLEWWTADTARADAPAIVKLAAETDPRAVGFRDYTQLPWFEQPCATGRPHVTGPYVDYVCTDQYTLTFTRPLVVAGGFAGVVGADVLVARFEEHLLQVMESVDCTCVVVNRAGRVVTSSDPTWVTGDLIRGLPLEAWLAGRDTAATAEAPWAARPCDGIPFLVLSPRGETHSP